ncbi:hypothetical protein ABQF35_30635, partial [Mycobacterium syngnathidarum]
QLVTGVIEIVRIARSGRYPGTGMAVSANSALRVRPANGRRAVMAIDVLVAQRIQSTVRQPGYLKAWIRDS